MRIPPFNIFWPISHHFFLFVKLFRETKTMSPSWYNGKVKDLTKQERLSLLALFVDLRKDHPRAMGYPML